MTKSVWRERAVKENTWPFKDAIATEPTKVVEQKPMTLAERLAAKGLK